MDSNEIFERLLALRQRLVSDAEAPLGGLDCAFLWDVAVALGLDDAQAGQVAGDPQRQPVTVEPEPQPEPAAYDFLESGLGIGRIGDADRAGEYLASLRAAEIEREQAARDPYARQPLLCSCGHYDPFPMSTARGSACADCYDRMSD